MRISDLTLDHVRAGGVWWVPNIHEELLERRLPLEELSIVEQGQEDIEGFTDEDHVAYIGIRVTDSGRVTPLVLVREIGVETGGDYCELTNGVWNQLGVIPNPGLRAWNDVFQLSTAAGSRVQLGLGRLISKRAERRFSEVD